MVFSSLTFLIIFLPLVLFMYYLAERRYRNFILLIFSLLFYAWGEPKYVFLMLASITVNYLAGILIDKFENNLKRVILSAAVIFNIGLLIYFKYTNFFIRSSGLNIKMLDIILPIGISFFTFQALSYVIDVYRKHTKCQRNFINLAFYISFFPQLIAGPIVRYNTIDSQILERHESIDKFSEGLRRLIVGLAKKVMLANPIGLIVASIIDQNNYSELTLAAAWFGVFCFGLQIYFDFSGYSDMAIGLAKLFGFEFQENFNYPFISKTITEFWSRWHISLSTWFKDYLYIPLGGSRVKVGRHIFNLLLVWTITGLWHGADMNFALWGLWFAIILISEKYLLKKILDKLPNPITWLYTMIMLLLSFVIFRVENFQMTKIYFQTMIGLNFNGFADIELSGFIRNNFVLILVAMLAATPVGRNLYRKFSHKRSVRIAVDVSLVLLLVLSLASLASGGFNPFIYFRF